jgi:hypothetical protein
MELPFHPPGVRRASRVAPRSSATSALWRRSQATGRRIGAGRCRGTGARDPRSPSSSSTSPAKTGWPPSVSPTYVVRARQGEIVHLRDYVDAGHRRPPRNHEGGPRLVNLMLKLPRPSRRPAPSLGVRSGAGCEDRPMTRLGSASTVVVLATPPLAASCSSSQASSAGSGSTSVASTGVGGAAGGDGSSVAATGTGGETVSSGSGQRRLRRRAHEDNRPDDAPGYQVRRLRSRER